MRIDGFLEAVGLAIIIASLAVSCEFCDRPDKSQGPVEWFGGCDKSKTMGSELDVDRPSLGVPQ